LLKFFLPLPPTLPQFEQSFFILSASAAAMAALAAFFPFFLMLIPSNDAERKLLALLSGHSPPRFKREI
jgi:hypothetical protein